MPAFEYRSLREIKTIDQMITLQSNICKVGLKKLMVPRSVAAESYTDSYNRFLNNIEQFDNLYIPLSKAVNNEFGIHKELLFIVVLPLRESLFIVLDAELRRRSYNGEKLKDDLSNAKDILEKIDKDLCEKFLQLTGIIGRRLLVFTYANIIRYVQYTTSIYKNTF